MRKRLGLLSVGLSALCLSSAWAGPAQHVPIQQSAVDIPATPRWYIGAEGMWEARDLSCRGEVMELDAWHVDAVLGVQPVSWMMLQGGVGVAQASRDDLKTDAGLDWLVRLRANIAEYVFTTKPGVGRHQVLRLCASGSYRDSEANFDDSEENRYFNWNEWLFEPYLQYSVNRLGEGNYDSLDVASVAFRAGPVFSWIDGRYDYKNIDERRTYGLAIGGDVLLASGLTLGIEARAYGRDDASLGASLGHRF